MRIAIDFDGTIIKNVELPVEKQLFYKYTDYEFVDGCEDAIRSIAKKHELVLCSSRYGWYRIPMIMFIKSKKLPIRVYILNTKPAADVYVDDKNYGGIPIDWEEIKKNVLCL